MGMLHQNHLPARGTHPDYPASAITILVGWNPVPVPTGQVALWAGVGLAQLGCLCGHLRPVALEHPP